MRTIWMCCLIFQTISRFPTVSMFTITRTSTYATIRSPRFIIGSSRFSSGTNTISSYSSGSGSCSICTSASNSVTASSSIEEVDQQIQNLEKKFYELNNHTLINLGSPKQVAKAIQCANTTNSCLQHIVAAPQQHYTSLQRQMADTMLQWKIWKRRKVQLLQGRSFSNSTSTIVNNSNNNRRSTGASIATSISSNGSSIRNG